MNLIKLRKIGIRGVLLLALLVFLTACPGDDLPVETIIPTTTKVPDKATRDLLSVYNPDTGIMRFTASTAILDNLKTGDVFVGEPSAVAPVGYLRKVNKISKEGAEVILETSQAKLTDAVHQGTLNVEGQLGKSQLNEVTPLMEGAYGGVSQTPSGDLSPQIDFGNGFSFQTGVDIILEAKGDNGEATVHFKGDVRFNVGYKIAIDIGFLADLNSIEASLGFDEHEGISIDADASGV